MVTSASGTQAVQCKPEVQEPGPESHTLGPAIESTGCGQTECRSGTQARLSWSLPQELASSGGGWVAHCKHVILCPLNHTLFTLAQVSEQLFPLPSLFKMIFWTWSIPLGIQMQSELCSPKTLQTLWYVFSLPLVLQHLVTFPAYTQQDHWRYFSLPQHWDNAFFEIYPRKQYHHVWHNLYNLSQRTTSSIMHTLTAIS